MSGAFLAPCARPFAFAKGRRLTIRLLGFDRARLIGLDDQLGVGTRFELAVKALYPVEDGYIAAAHGFRDFLPPLALSEFPDDCLVVKLISKYCSHFDSP